MNKRKKIKRYFRYHHFKSIPTSESHSDFIECLSQLEYEADIYPPIAESGEYSIEEDWQRILDGINSLNEDQVKNLYRLIKIK